MQEGLHQLKQQTSQLHLRRLQKHLLIHVDVIVNWTGTGAEEGMLIILCGWRLKEETKLASMLEMFT